MCRDLSDQLLQTVTQAGLCSELGCCNPPCGLCEGDSSPHFVLLTHSFPFLSPTCINLPIARVARFDLQHFLAPSLPAQALLHHCLSALPGTKGQKSCFTFPATSGSPFHRLFFPSQQPLVSASAALEAQCCHAAGQDPALRPGKGRHQLVPAHPLPSALLLLPERVSCSFWGKE